MSAFERVQGNAIYTPTEARERQVREAAQIASHLWPCGCLINDAGAHRVGCPDHPEGVRG